MEQNKFTSNQMSSGFKWFMIAFISIVFLSTIISFYGNNLAKNSITTQVSNATVQTSLQAIGKMDQMLTVYESIGQQMLRNNDLRKKLSALPSWKNNSAAYDIFNRNYMQSLLNGYKDSVPNVAYVRILKNNGWKNDNQDYFTSIPSPSMRVQPRDEELVKTIIKNDGNPYWSNTTKAGYFRKDVDTAKNSGGYSFLMGMLLKNLQNPENSYIVTVEVKISAIEKLMENVDLGPESDFQVVDNNHNIIFSKDEKTIGQKDTFGISFDHETGSETINVNGTSWLTTYAKSGHANWYLVTRVPVSSLHRDVEKITNYTIVTMILLLLVVGGTIYLFNRFRNLFAKLSAYSDEISFKSIQLEESNQILLDKNAHIERQSNELIEKNDILSTQSTKLEQQNAELEELNRVKDQILANTSHELRTPINGIIGIAESLIDGVAGQLNEIARKNILIIVNSGRRLTNLVNDILDFSKMKNEKLIITQRAIRVEPIAEMVLLLSKPLVGNKTIELKQELPKNLPMVFADDHRLQQIFHNLISNAIKFTESGAVTIGATSKGDFIDIWVRDSGIGIPADKYDVIFKSFEQVDGSTQRNYGGTGLGLAVTKQLIELHGGTIKVSSELGKGTTFTFEIPVASEEQITSQPVSDSAVMFSDKSLLSAESFEPVKFEQIGEVNILVVDDEPINLQVLANHLIANDFGITTAANGIEALAILKSSKTQFDLVLLDVMMPKLSGYEVCKTIRQTYTLNELPVILLTAKNQPEDIITGFKSGANDYLTKPFAKEELIIRMQTHLRLSKSQKQIRIMRDRFEKSERV